MREIKLYAYDDHEEGHSRAFGVLMFEKITTIKEFLKKVCQEWKVEIGTLLTSLISIRYIGSGNIKSIL